MKRKNVGIVTFHRAVNCGAFLQCYALQKTVTDLGYKAEVIDYYSEQQQKKYNEIFPREGSIVARSKHFVENLLNLPFVRHEHNKYHRFIEGNLSLSKLYRREDDFEGVEDKYSKFIVGSDQVWNSSFDDFSNVYLLPFVRGEQKLSYAASFGKNAVKAVAPIIDEIRQFAEVSVREQDGVDELKKYDVKACRTLDPTLLLQRSDYDKFANSVVAPKRDYIFFYFVTDHKSAYQAVKKISEMTGLPVVIMDSRHAISSIVFMGKRKLIRSATPDTMIGLIRGAKLVVTSSFHGAALSAIHHKPVIILNNPKEDARFMTLYDLGLKNNFWKASNRSLNIEDYGSYSDFDAQLKSEMRASLGFLVDCLR